VTSQTVQRKLALFRVLLGQNGWRKIVSKAPSKRNYVRLVLNSRDARNMLA